MDTSACASTRSCSFAGAVHDRTKPRASLDGARSGGSISYWPKPHRVYAKGPKVTANTIPVCETQDHPGRWVFHTSLYPEARLAVLDLWRPVFVFVIYRVCVFCEGNGVCGCLRHISCANGSSASGAGGASRVETLWVLP